MQRLSFTVPVELIQTVDDTMLVVQDSLGQQAAFLFSQVTEPVAKEVVERWAKERITECLLKRRKPTGALDSKGTMIFEGDIVEVTPNEYHGVSTAMVKYHPPYGAFVVEGRYAGGNGAGGWGTLNMQDSRTFTVIGNVFQTPERLVETDRPTIKDESDFDEADYVTRGGREPAQVSGG